MGRDRINTGGLKEFHYDKDYYKRIESEDTESTREFKKALREWRKEQRNINIKDYTKRLVLAEDPVIELEEVKTHNPVSNDSTESENFFKIIVNKIKSWFS